MVGVGVDCGGLRNEDSEMAVRQGSGRILK